MHLAALTVLGSVHFNRRADGPAEPVSAEVSVHTVERIIETPAPKPKPKVAPAPTIETPPSPETMSPVEAPVEPTAPPAEAPKSRAPETVLFSGTHTAAQRVCYVIDGSGSMFGLMYLVRQQVRESILGLSGEQSFNVVFFMAGGQLLQAFDGRLERAGSSARAEALNLLGRIRPEGQTDGQAALEAALRMRDRDGLRPEVIYFVTDGFDLKDDGGRAFLKAVGDLRQAAAPTTVIHAIGVYPGPDDRHILKQLADVGEGRYIEVQ